MPIKARTTPVRVSPMADAALGELVKLTGATKIALLDEAVQDLHKKRLWAAITSAYDTHGPAIHAEYVNLDGDVGDMLLEGGEA